MLQILFYLSLNQYTSYFLSLRGDTLKNVKAQQNFTRILHITSTLQN